MRQFKTIQEPPEAIVGLTSSSGPLREEKGPGTHCLHMLHYPKNLRGSYSYPFTNPHMCPCSTVCC